MRLWDFISVRISLGLTLGILLNNLLNLSSLYWLLPFLISIFLFGAILKMRKYNVQQIPNITFFLNSILLGALVHSLTLPINQKLHYSHKTTPNPQQLTLTIQSELKPNAYARNYIVSVNSLSYTKTKGLALLNIAKDSLRKQSLEPGDQLVSIAKIKSVTNPLNPYQFNYKKYLAYQGIHYRIQLRPEWFKKLDQKNSSIYTLSANYRNKIISRLKTEGFGSEELGIIQALLLGERNGVNKDVLEDYKKAGAIHILAVSGLHIGILLLLFNILLKPLERFPHGNQIKLLLGLLLLWTYAFIAGLSPSIVRACTMYSFLAYALLLNRPTNTFNLLALSYVTVLLINPLNLFQVGFQLSYTAVLAIVWLHPKLMLLWYPKNLFLNKIWQLLAVSIAAQLGVLPLSLFYFHQFPGLFFIANLLIVPFLGVILGLGLLTIVLSMLQVLPTVLVNLYNTLIRLMNHIIKLVAEQDAFVLTDISFDFSEVILSYTFILFGVAYFSKPKKNLLVISISALGLFLGVLLIKDIKASNRIYTYILHQNQQNVLLHQNGFLLNCYTNNSRNPYLIKNYIVAERIKHVNTQELQNAYTITHKNLFRIDSNHVLPPKNFKVDYLWLTHNPKINLNRLLEQHKPTMVIADGSNYAFMSALWKHTCLEKKIPFHDTRKKGAFQFPLDNN